MQHQKRKMVYNLKEEEKKFNVSNTLDSIMEINPIPLSKIHRIQYLDACINVVEKFHTCEDNRVSNPQIHEKMCVLSKRFSSFVMEYRESAHLSTDHRIIIWLIRCRIDIFIDKYIPNSPYSLERDTSGKADSFPFIKRHGLMVSPRPISIKNYDLTTLWNALVELRDWFNRLDFDKEIIRYVNCLYLRCANLTTICTKDKLVLNYRLYIKEIEGSNGFIAVNQRFLEQTETLFYNIQKRILLANFFYSVPSVDTTYITVERIKTKEEEEEGKEDKDSNWIRMDDAKKLNQSNWRLFFWLDECLNSLSYEFIMVEYQKKIYDTMIHPGERELFESENPHESSAAYNIFSTYRESVLKDIADQSKSFDSLLRRLCNSSFHCEGMIPKLESSHSEGIKFVDLESSLLCTIVLKFNLKMFDEEVEIEDYVYSRGDLMDEKRMKGVNATSKIFPIIIQPFNNYGVYFCNFFIDCPNIGSAILTWVSVACRDNRVRGLLPHEMENEKDAIKSLRKLYNVLFNRDPPFMENDLHNKRVRDRDNNNNNNNNSSGNVMDWR